MNPSKIKATYRIEYSNGMVQYKNLITDEDYQRIIKPIDSAVGQLNIHKEYSSQVHSLKKTIKDLFGDEYFTDVSPLFLAIKTGKLILPESQGGEHKVKINKKK